MMKDISREQLERLRSIYYLYLDETGHATYRPSKQMYRTVNERYLTIGRVFIRGDIYWKQLEPKINELKHDYFGTTDLVLHYTELFSSRGANLLRVEQREPFWSSFLDILKSTDLSLLSITVDKQGIQSKYGLWLWDPYHLIIAWHIERVIYTLSQIESQRKILESGGPPLMARLVIEARGGNQDPLTKEGKGPDRRLAASYRRVYNEGSKIFVTVKPKDVQFRLTSNEIAIANKKDNKNGLQVADLVCLPLHWNTLFELRRDDLYKMKGVIQKSPNVEMFWNRARHKIATSTNGTLEGYGIKIFPEKDLLEQ